MLSSLTAFLTIFTILLIMEFYHNQLILSVFIAVHRRILYSYILGFSTLTY